MGFNTAGFTPLSLPKESISTLSFHSSGASDGLFSPITIIIDTYKIEGVGSGKYYSERWSLVGSFNSNGEGNVSFKSKNIIFSDNYGFGTGNALSKSITFVISSSDASGLGSALNVPVLFVISNNYGNGLGISNYTPLAIVLSVNQANGVGLSKISGVFVGRLLFRGKYMSR